MLSAVSRTPAMPNRRSSATVLIADDCCVIRQGIAAILSGQENFKIVAESANGREAVELSAKWCPDIVVMDIGMPGMNGVDATRRILRADPKIRVMGFIDCHERRFVPQLLRAGACALLDKAAERTDILAAFRAVLGRKPYCSPEVAAGLQGLSGSVFAGSAPTPESLTLREREILQLLAEGLRAREIAALLNISRYTVEAHRGRIMRKINGRSLADLTRHALREGIAWIGASR